MDIREMKEDDLVSYQETLSNLRPVSLESKKAITTLKKMQEQDGHIFVIMEDDKVLACATVLIEQKFIHDAGKIAHIEDVATSPVHEGKGLGKQIIAHALAYAKERGCYKVILDCSQELIPFYEKCGFSRKEIQMRYDIR